MTGPVGVTLFAHGSSVASANDSVRRIAESFRAASGYALVEPSFLELAQPDLSDAVATLVAQGARRILVIPYFLTLGIHLQRDLPGIVRRIESIYTDVTIEVTPPLDGHPALLDALLDRAREGLHGGGGSEGPADRVA